MTALRLSWTIPTADLAARIADGYDQQMVERDIGGGFVELSRETTRVPLAEFVEAYVYADPAGDVSYNYQVTYRKSADGSTYATPLAITNVVEDGYCTVTEIRAEGVAVADATDAMVERAIAWAGRYIEKYCRRWFGPRFVPTMRKGGRPDEEAVFFDVPIKPVCEKPANDLGLFDMTGSVNEWVADWYQEDAYKTMAAKDPKGPAEGRNGVSKVIRGGSWNDFYGFSMEAWARFPRRVDHRYKDVGFRCVAPATVYVEDLKKALGPVSSLNSKMVGHVLGSLTYLGEKAKL